jgi:M6 family metalloprotease-like protein
MKTLTTLIISTLFNICCFGAYLTNVPITLVQPNGTIVNCFATGDEYYNWVHDSLGYTILQNQITGYYHYAIRDNESLICSNYIVGNISPQSIKIQPYINISPAQILAKRNSIYQMDSMQVSLMRNTASSQSTPFAGTINNIVVYIRFSDQVEFPENQSYYSTMFNSTVDGTNSMRNYFRELAYNQIDVASLFYPSNNGTVIISYLDGHERNYYCPYSSTNTSGYGDETDRRNREHTLLHNAIDYIAAQIPASLNIDNNNDGFVDNVCFIIKGGTTAWNTLLWPHRWSLYSQTVYINGKRVYDYNFQLENSIASQGTSVLSHEMCHTFGAPDLYHYNNDNMDPVGDWDVMEHNKTPPQHMGAYMKYKYGGWISTMPTITASGTYTINPLTVATNNCYRINIQGSNQFLVLEYRKKTGTFENSLPGSGLIIYRINSSYSGNSNGVGPGGVSDEVYVFRPNGTISAKGNNSIANFSEAVSRSIFSNSTNPYCFISNGDFGNIFLKNIKENSNNTLSFDVRFCDGDNIVYSNTNSLPPLTNASSSIQTSGSVIVENSDNVIFEAGEEVILNGGFEVKQGGTFEININDCGN